MMTIGWKLYISPIDQRPVNRVLDIGCGTGVWSMEFGMLLLLPPDDCHQEDTEFSFSFLLLPKS